MFAQPGQGRKAAAVSNSFRVVSVFHFSLSLSLHFSQNRSRYKSMSDTPETPQSNPEPYRVLARKYRPQNFEELIGQDTLVRTLKNAIESGRIAHAFMLTGVRGVGKTTTARIIAKALNYAGPDSNAGPTTSDTSDCPICQAISADRHPDVIEMDAASRTGVDDIREILDGVRYAPTEARYKVYVIDEVHMLSKQAFNALLKTLEEPPEHVKFIFATTEIRKVPVTVLSRCQRFDLARVNVETLSGHFAGICEKENVAIEEEALGLIARAADGSVRDGLSLLDRAIALSGEKIDAAHVKDMLGLADRARIFDVLEAVLTGNIAEALDIMDTLYKSGMDAIQFMQDLLELTHLLTRLRAVPGATPSGAAMGEDEMKRAGDIAGKLSMPTLGRAWQILLKGLAEVQAAPNPQNAAEVVIIRLAYAADLPDPADLMKSLKDGGNDASAPSGGGNSTPSGSPAPREPAPVAMQGGGGSGGPAAALAPEPQPQTETQPITALHTLEDVVATLEQQGEMILAGQVYQFVHLVKLAEGQLEIRLTPEAPEKIPQLLGKALEAATGNRWMISISGAPGQPTLAQKKEQAHQAELNAAMQNEVVKKVFELFPDAKITAITAKEEN